MCTLAFLWLLIVLPLTSLFLHTLRFLRITVHFITLCLNSPSHVCACFVDVVKSLCLLYCNCNNNNNKITHLFSLSCNNTTGSIPTGLGIVVMRTCLLTCSCCGWRDGGKATVVTLLTWLWLTGVGTDVGECDYISWQSWKEESEKVTFTYLKWSRLLWGWHTNGRRNCWRIRFAYGLWRIVFSTWR